MAIDPKDSGWKSRKFWLTVHSLHVIVALGLIAAHWSALGAYLTVLVGGITAVLGLYFGAGAWHQNLVVKSDGQTPGDK